MDITAIIIASAVPIATLIGLILTNHVQSGRAKSQVVNELTEAAMLMIEPLKSSLDVAERKIKLLSVDIEAYRAENLLLKERVQSLEAQLITARSEIENRDKRIHDLECEIKALRRQINGEQN